MLVGRWLKRLVYVIVIIFHIVESFLFGGPWFFSGFGVSTYILVFIFLYCFHWLGCWGIFETVFPNKWYQSQGFGGGLGFRIS